MGVLVVEQSAGLLGRHAYFVHWGVIQISLANLIVIALMVVVFIAALVIPFPGHANEPTNEPTDGQPDEHH